jgi:hypothetical protein
VNLKSHFPHASPDFIQLNSPANSQLSPTKPQQDAADALGGSSQGKVKSMGRATICYRCRFVRPRDTDNLFGSLKQLTDGLRACRLLQNDDPSTLWLVVEQERVKHFSDEHIEIEITYHDL